MVRFGIVVAWFLSITWLLAILLDMISGTYFDSIHAFILLTNLPIAICLYKPAFKA